MKYSWDAVPGAIAYNIYLEVPRYDEGRLATWQRRLLWWLRLPGLELFTGRWQSRLTKDAYYLNYEFVEFVEAERG